MAAPKGNKNAEKWSLEEAKIFFQKATDLSKDSDYDFIGEVAVDLEQDKGVFDYLMKKFPNNGFEGMKKLILSRCEVNCFRNAKKGNIIPSLAIINLKSNHGWKDAMQHEGSAENPIKHSHDINVNILNTGLNISTSETDIKK